MKAKASKVSSIQELTPKVGRPKKSKVIKKAEQKPNAKTKKVVSTS